MSVEADLIDGDIDEILRDLTTRDRAAEFAREYREAFGEHTLDSFNYSSIFPRAMPVMDEPKGRSFRWFMDTVPVVLHPTQTIRLTGV